MLEVHVNFGGAEEAATVSREAVEKRLAACANLSGAVRSFYWWNGAVQSEEETAVVFKTADDRVDGLIAFLAERHSHEVPAITVHRAHGGHAPFLDWVEAETRGAA